MEFLTKNLSYLLAGISVGGQYALIAIGYTMVCLLYTSDAADE